MDNTSCRLSSNYESAAEDSISLYYSFNGSNADKTLENSCNSTFEETIEEKSNTVVKVPPSGIPVKSGLRKSLNLSKNSTPAKMLQKRQIKRVQDAQVTSSSPRVNGNEVMSGIKRIETTVEKTIETCQVVIVDGCNEIKIETSTDSSREKVIDGTVESEIDILEKNENRSILKDASIKVASEANKMETISETNDQFVEKNTKDETDDDGEVEIKSRSFRNSLADNMVEEIRTLLRGTVVDTAKHGKENIRKDVSLDLPKSGGLKTDAGDAIKKETIQILKPSRLSVKSRRTVYHSEQQSTTSKAITPIMRITQNAKKPSPVGSSAVSLSRDASSSAGTSQTSFKSITESKTVFSQRRSMLPSSKRASMVTDSKSSLFSIPENKQQGTTKPAGKRMSLMNGGGGGRNETLKSNKRLSIAKTTLNSPSLTKRDAARRSVANRRSMMPSQTLTKGSSEATIQTRTSTTTKSSDFSTDTAKQLKPSSAIGKFPREDFVCKICSRSFRVSSIFEAHKKTHNPTTSRQANVCRYCDRSFAIMKALDKHLLENCLKIPLAERKKIKVAAEERAEEEAVVRGAEFIGAKNRQQPTKRVSILPPQSSSSLRPVQRKSMAVMPPPTTSKVVKKSVAYSGISRTPSKAVSCRPCDKSFDDVISYAEHMLSHSVSSLGEE